MSLGRDGEDVKALGKGERRMLSEGIPVERRRKISPTLGGNFSMTAICRFCRKACNIELQVTIRRSSVLKNSAACCGDERRGLVGSSTVCSNPPIEGPRGIAHLERCRIRRVHLRDIDVLLLMDNMLTQYSVSE